MEYGESGDNRAELVRRPEETDQMVMGVGNDMERLTSLVSEGRRHSSFLD